MDIEHVQQIRTHIHGGVAHGVNQSSVTAPDPPDAWRVTSIHAVGRHSLLLLMLLLLLLLLVILTHHNEVDVAAAEHQLSAGHACLVARNRHSAAQHKHKHRQKRSSSVQRA